FKKLILFLISFFLLCPLLHASEVVVNQSTMTLNGTVLSVSNVTVNTSGNFIVNGATITLTENLSTSGIYNQLSGSVTVKNVSINSGGNFTLTGGTVRVRGNWAKANDGDVDHTDGYIAFIDSGLTSTISGNTTFYSFECTLPNKVIAFTVGSTQTIRTGGNFNLQGTDGNLIIATSTAAGFWYLQLFETHLVSYVDATNSYVYSGDGDKDVVRGEVIGETPTCLETNTHWWVVKIPGLASWESPIVDAEGFTLNNRPFLRFRAPSGAIDFTDAEVRFSTSTAFTEDADVAVYYATHSVVDSADWGDWIIDEALATNSPSTFTVTSDLTRNTTTYFQIRLYDDFTWGNYNSTVTVRVSSSTAAYYQDADLTGLPIREIHFTELQTAIKNLRIFRGLSEGAWTNFDDATTGVAVGRAIRAVHVNELRTNLKGVLDEIGETETWSYGTLTGGTDIIDKDHILDLRTDTGKP
ncbi:hypothetical protein ACFL4A_03505, partial [bacterium]